jgi:hypothetical protein
VEKILESANQQHTLQKNQRPLTDLVKMMSNLIMVLPNFQESYLTIGLALMQTRLPALASIS